MTDEAGEVDIVLPEGAVEGGHRVFFFGSSFLSLFGKLG